MTEQRITSRKNPLLQQVKKLFSSRRERESAGLFAALRELDDPAIHQVFARCPEGGGVAYAVQNRLKKAAAFHIINAEEDL